MSEARPGRALDAALEQLRLDGAIFFRAEFTEAWSYESPTPEQVAAVLHPGAERLIQFHIVSRGSLWISVGDGERHHARAGDVIVLPYGDQHRVGGHEDAPCVPIITLFDPPPWQALPVVQYGRGGPRTDMVCGYLHSTDALFDPSLRALPRVIVVRPPEGAASEWVRSSIRYALSEAEAHVPGAPPSTRLPELLVTEVLRHHLATAPASDYGWLGALRDPVLGPALAQIHGAPERKWTVSDLASSAAVTRSVLDERFRRVLGRSPIRYLTEWRMHVAENLLRATDQSVSEVARLVGYESEEAFSRAFKRSHGEAPGAWRTAARATE